MDSYPTKYFDAHGAETTSMLNDGVTLRMTLRGIEFVSTEFEQFDPPEDATPELLSQFALFGGHLCSCRIECQIPIPVHDPGRLVEGSLQVGLLLGDPQPNGFLDRVELHIALELDGKRFSGSGKSGWFEDELLEIQRQLPDGVFIKACINCLYSDYSPAGHGVFGSMMCFRNVKAEYLKVKSKREFWPLRCERAVQETYLCPEFERRVPGTGYRG